jgi:hypothetical protein
LKNGLNFSQPQQQLKSGLEILLIPANAYKPKNPFNHFWQNPVLSNNKSLNLQNQTVIKQILEQLSLKNIHFTPEN